MREIKFRAWNGKKMIFYSEWFTLHRQSVLCFEEPPHDYVDESDFDFPERVILMQYTGFKDKNGKEIYEGDIVNNQHGAVGEYVWSERRSGWDIQFRKFPGFETMNEWEVIGNIYENPELLT